MMLLQAAISDLALTGITVLLEPGPEHVRVLLKNERGVQAKRNAAWDEASLAATISQLAAVLRQ
jgi:hypothetical protein